MSNLYYVISIIIMISIFLLNVLITKSVLQPTDKSQTRKNKTKPEKVIVYLGSGGHTGEMLKILGTYENTIKESQLSILYSDNNSLLRFENQFKNFKNVTSHKIGKARQVNASKISSVISIFQTIVSIIKLFIQERNIFLFNHKNTLLLLNGPGSCVLLSILFQIIKLITFKDYSKFKIIYIESLARCNSLSMTGFLIYYLKLSDEFIVQWQEMCKKYPYSKCYGILV